MREAERGMAELFEEMLKLRLISTGNLWVEIAIRQKNTRLPIAIANSRLLTYDRIDRTITRLNKIN
jgi:hypothetical protein